MGHGLTARDKMAFVGQVPWHAHQNAINITEESKKQRITAKYIQELTMDWQVEVIDQFGRYNGIEIPNPDERMVIRVEEGEDPFKLSMVGGDYTVLQNWEIAKFADELCAVQGRETDVYFETGGTLFEGRKVWFMARLNSDIAITRLDGTVDEAMKYFVVASNHDGRGSLKVCATPIRVVCHNTLSFALRGASNVYSMRHTPNLTARMNECREAVKLQSKFYRELEKTLQSMAQERFNADQTRAFAASVVGDVNKVVASIDEVIGELREDNASSNRVERVVDEAEKIAVLARDGKGNTGETKVDAFNGLTEFLDHHRERYRRAADQQTRMQKHMDSTLWGEHSRMKGRAVKLLKKW